MIRCIKACMAGPYHLDNGLPCQDSLYVRDCGDGAVIAAVADGLGSQKYSDVGSRIASETAVSFCAEHFVAGMTFKEVRKIMRNAFVDAYRAVLKEAASIGEFGDQHDTTLCLAIWDDGHVFWGQAGDSGIAALMKSGEYVPVTVQQRTEEGYVFPLCCGPEKWAFGEITEKVSALMLMTDGVWENIVPPELSDDERKMNVALARLFMDRKEDQPEEIATLESNMQTYLENFPRQLLDDDKTVIILYNPDTPAARLDDAYYQPPDWEAIARKRQARWYDDDPDEPQYQDETQQREPDEPQEANVPYEQEAPTKQDELGTHDKKELVDAAGGQKEPDKPKLPDKPYTKDAMRKPRIFGSFAKQRKAAAQAGGKRRAFKPSCSGDSVILEMLISVALLNVLFVSCLLYVLLTLCK